MNGPGGDLPLLLWDGSRVRVICGQGPAPAAATIDAYRALGYDLVPGRRPVRRVRAGRVRRVVHAAAGLRDVGAGGRARVRDRLRARRVPGHARDRQRDRADRARVGGVRRGSGGRWTGACATRCWPTPTSGSPPCPGRRGKRGSTPRATPGTAAGWRRRWPPGSSRPTTWRRTRPSSRSRCRCGSGTGRCSRPGRGARDRCSCSSSRCCPTSSARSWAIEHVHTVVEGAKLAFADRDAWYGDSAPVPLDLLLSREYAAGAARADRRARLRRAAARRPVAALPVGARGRASATPSPRAATPATWTSRTASATS